MSTSEGKHLSFEEKNSLVQFIFGSCIEGKPPYGKLAEAAHLFGVHRKTVANLWATAKRQMQEGKPISIQSKRIGLSYKKIELDEVKLKSIDAQKRSTIRDLATEMGVGKIIVEMWLKEGKVKPHTNAIKPLLTDPNKIQRLEFSLSQLHVDRIENKIKFGDMKNVIHIDEKWFYITTTKLRYYKLPSEVGKHRTCKSKKFITKVMFLCAVARPHYANDGTLLFDGKIGIFPFTEEVPALRNSKNRQRGTLETKNIQSITKEVVKNCIINEVSELSEYFHHLVHTFSFLKTFWLLYYMQ